MAEGLPTVVYRDLSFIIFFYRVTDVGSEICCSDAVLGRY